MIEAADLAIEAAFREGAVRALRKRAKVQADRAIAGEAIAGEKFPDVVIRSGESVVARGLSQALSALADEFEQEGTR
jgi:hypothetical protein